MKVIRKFKTVSLLGLVFILAFGMIGCGDDSNSSAVTNPNPTPLQPTGHIQGILTDASTAEPIVNAIIDIGVSRATTTSTGQFVLSNVPVTEDATVDGAAGNTFAGHYEVTIDMRNVTSPVNMTSADTTVRYGDFYFDDAEVIFSSLNDTDGDYVDDLDSYESATNHDTPVTGLVATQNFMVGKMSATLTGVVAGCADTAVPPQPISGNEADFYDFKEGVTVLLLATGGSTPDDTASGNSGNLVAATTTDANGAFTFANIESGQTFLLIAKSADGMSDNSAGTAVSAIGDGLTTSLVNQRSSAIHICTADVHGPAIIAQSVENGADIAPSTTQAVTFTFSEAVEDTAYSNVSGSPVANLRDSIGVYWGANKAATAVAFSAAWNTAMTQLTVTFPTAGSSLYWVRINNIGSLTDANLVAAEIGTADDDGSVPGAWNVADIGANAGTDDPTVYFTTYAGVATSAPSAIAVVNATTINQGSSVILDWSPVAGAKEYNIYRKKIELWQDGTTSETDNIIYLATSQVSAYTDVNPGFVADDETRIQYYYYVATVNSDDVESVLSTVTVLAKDVVGPSITNGDTTGAEAAFLASAPIPTALGTSATANFVLTLGEALSEAAAETLSNYSIGKIFGAAATDVAPTISNPVYNETAHTVTLTLTITRASGADTFTDDFYISTTVTDVAGNAAASTADLWDYNAGAAQ